MQIRGDLFSHEFTIDRDGQVVVTVSKRWLSVTASYAVEVAPGEDGLLILASVLALDLASMPNTISEAARVQPCGGANDVGKPPDRGKSHLPRHSRE
jgi:hypothetical protein